MNTHILLTYALYMDPYTELFTLFREQFVLTVKTSIEPYNNLKIND
jgi:hypothetical protein